MSASRASSAFVAVFAVMLSLMAQTATARQSSSGQPAIYVSPIGSDDNSGEVTAPVRTLRRALEIAQEGPAAVLVASGDYGPLSDRVARDGVVSITGIGNDKPTVAGATLSGSTHLHFTNIKFSDLVTITSNPNTKALAADLNFEQVDMTGGCLAARNFTDLLLANSWLHGCEEGVAGAAGGQSTGVIIRNNLITDMTGDGLIFGNWSKVLITRNVVEGIHFDDNNPLRHNDALQTLGNDSDLTITDNYFGDSAHQLLLIQQSQGPNTGILVQNNVFNGAGAIAIQNGTVGTRFINNTIWNAAIAGVILRGGPGDPDGPKTVVANNIISRLLVDSDRTAIYSTNAVAEACDEVPQAICLSAAPFVNAAEGNFELPLSSSLRGRGDTSYNPGVDFLGRIRPTIPSLGAYDPPDLVVPGPSPTPSPSPVSSTSPGPDASPAAIVMQPTYRLTFIKTHQRQTRRRLLHRGLRVRVFCTAACDPTLGLFVAATGSHGHGALGAVLGSRQARVWSFGLATVRIRLSPAGAHVLRRVGKIALLLTGDGVLNPLPILVRGEAG